MALEYCTLESVGLRLGITGQDTLLQTFVDSTNVMIERRIGCAIGPSSDTQRVYDGYAIGSMGLFVRDGIRTLTAMDYAAVTGNTWTAVDITTVLLRPFAWDREPGWPAQYVSFQDVAPSYFYPGNGNLRLTGTFGFSEIPADLEDVADTTCIRAWLARRTGQTDVAGYDESGNPMISRFLSYEHKMTLDAYKKGTRNWYRRPLTSPSGYLPYGS